MWELSKPCTMAGQRRLGVGGRLLIVPFRRGLEIIVLRFGLSSGVAEDMRHGAEWRAWKANAG